MEPAGGSAEKVGEGAGGGGVMRAHVSDGEDFFPSLFFLTKGGRTHPLFFLSWELPVRTNETWRQRLSVGGQWGGGMLLLSSCQSVPSGERPEGTRVTRPDTAKPCVERDSVLCVRFRIRQTRPCSWPMAVVGETLALFFWLSRSAVRQFAVGIQGHCGLTFLFCC